ncbi:MAG: peptidylprolyl isomerase [Rickettsiales bacterium]|nr:peptidylprolyl isomerase [Rickettsiales bacterium]
MGLARKIETNMENTLYLDLKDGRVVIRMLPDVAPKHVARIKELVRSKFYNGLTFHRVIEGFMAQGGDPNGNGTGGSGKKIPAEFTKKYSHKRGAVSMARAQDPNSADSQFFIVTADSTYLDSQYTIWGYVVSGMEFVDNIKKGNSMQNGLVQDPDKIVKMTIASDVKGK